VLNKIIEPVVKDISGTKSYIIVLLL